MSRDRATPALRVLLGALLGFAALNAFAGGVYGLSGAHGVPTEWLAGSPFADYFVPSLILFAVVGGACLLAAIAVFADSRRARVAAIVAGMVVLGWLLVQVLIIGYVSLLQPVTAIGGAVVIALAALLPREQASRPQTLRDAATRFLRERRIAVTGVSRAPQGHGSNIVYQRLRQRGYRVFAVNPNAETVEGEPCYRDLRSIPGGVGAVVIGTRPEAAEATMQECADLGIQQVWMHRAFGKGSVSDAATEYGRQRGITVIDGACPCMFDPAADPGHKIMRFVLGLAGKLPRPVAPPCSTSVDAVEIRGITVK